MRKETTKILGLSILALFIISVFAGIVSARTIWDDGKDFLSAKNVSQGTQEWVSKVLLIVLLALLIYSIAGAIPFVPDNDTVRWLIAIVISLLSFLFVPAGDILYILVNYQALGIALTTFIPLLIILIFTVEFGNKKPEFASIFNKLILILFALYIGFAWFKVDYGEGASPALAWAYPLTLVITLIWLFIEGKVTRFFFKKRMKGVSNKVDQFEDAHILSRINSVKEMMTNTPELANELRPHLQALEAEARKRHLIT